MFLRYIQKDVKIQNLLFHTFVTEKLAGYLRHISLL